jgi:hypothetical protein
MRSFEGYFQATEGAFAEEKEAMLDLIHQGSGSWEETMELDLRAAKLCEELQGLKGVLSKAHLQILRTREEMVRLELQNSQRAFRVRQLQAEIWRFLPHATSFAETVDYELSVERIGGQRGEEKLIDADEKLAKELSGIRQHWEDLLNQQDIVLNEEMEHRVSDNAYFEKFRADFVEQNVESHQAINDVLGRLIARIVFERNASNAMSEQFQDRMNSLNRQQQQLTEKSSHLVEDATKFALEERTKIQTQCARESRALRASIRRLEHSNLQKFVALQKKSTEMHRSHRDVLDRLQQLRRDEKRLISSSPDEIDHLRNRLLNLEARMNALISSATGIATAPDDHHSYLLRMVASTLGEQGRIAESVEQVRTQLKNAAERIGRSGRRIH